MAAVLHKTADPVDYRTSVHTPDFPAGTWFIDPDISGVAAVPTKYWQRPLADPVVEMTQPEKDAVDAAEAAALTQANRDVAVGLPDELSGDGVRVRALIELLNKRDNYLVNRVAELQGALVALQSSGGNAGARLDGLPASYLATATRPKADAVQDYKDDINAGNQDT